MEGVQGINMDGGEMKMTFGIQPEHIAVIEQIRDKWDKVEVSGVPKSQQPNMLYSEALWKEVGTQIGWDPFTICLYYFKHLEKHK